MNKFLKSLIVIAAILVLGLGSLAEAATMSFTPSAGQYAVGQTIAVAVLLSSSDQSANAVSATISFPTDKLSVTSVSKAGSIIQLWAAEPSYSNAGGSVAFEGIIPNPGFQGAGGRLVTIYFKIKAQGQGPVILTKSSVLANDGQGTDILTNVNNADFTLIAAAQQPPVTPPAEPAQTTPKPATKPKPRLCKGNYNSNNNRNNDRARCFNNI